MRRSSVAVVESATQLLNVAEWAYATGEAYDIRVLLLPPRAAPTMRQMNRVVEFIDDLGLEIHRLTVRSRTPQALVGGARAATALAGAERLILGDPFSRFVQTLLPLTESQDVVVVDDGTATWEFARCIDAGKPLLRWGVPLRGTERRAQRATRFFAPSPTRPLTVFSCLNDAA